MKKYRFHFVILLIFLFCNISHAQKEFSIDDVNQLMMKEDYQQSISVLESLISKDSTDAGLFYKLGVCCQKEYLYGKAIENYLRCIELDSSNIPARFSLGNCYSDIGDDKRSFEIFSEAFKKDSTNYKVGIMLASASIRLKKYQDAVGTYELLLKRDSLNYYLYRQLGYCAQMIDSSLLAAHYYNKALKLNNDDITAFQQLINVYLILKMEGLALDLLKPRILKDKDNLLYNKLLGETYFSYKNYDSAIIFYENANRLGDSSAYLFQKLGVAHYFYADQIDTSNNIQKQLFYSVSRHTLEKAFRVEPNAVTCYFLALANQKLNRPDAAVYYFDIAQDIIIPGFLPELFIHEAEAYVNLKDYIEAVEHYKKALAVNRDNTPLLLTIGGIYENNISDYDSAIHYYKQYLNTAADNPELTSKLKKRINELKKSL